MPFRINRRRRNVGTVKTITFSPFARVEGDMKIEVKIDNGMVAEAYASGTLYRGVEEILRGRSPMDAIVVTCRICGQCGASHSIAASTALAKIWGTVPPPNGIICSNIIQSIEMILSHIMHFYLSFAVDFAGAPYDAALTNRFASIKGQSFRDAIRARSHFLALLGIFAGKWPNTLAVQPGGVTKTVNSAEISKASGILAEFKRFLEENLFGCGLDEWLGVRNLSDLDGWLRLKSHAESDIGVFIRLARKAALENLGKGPARFLSGGGLPSHDGKKPWFKSGYYDGEFHEFDVSQITEHITHCWYESADEEMSPADSSATVKFTKEGAYSWCKAPRYMGKSVEVGPLARLVINGDPLALDCIKNGGAGVFARILARIREMAILTRQLAVWINAIDPGAPFYTKQKPCDGAACALVPAPRGILGHWVNIQDGLIKNYQIITPTGWNLSPRDSEGKPGPLEEALVGTAVDNGVNSKSISHIVRSFDPCLFCSVH
jgi:Ni,Fe-hydrogenase I large subunit